MEKVREWRNDARETLRTPYMLTQEMQADYYRDVICNRDSRTRYWAFIEKIGESGVMDKLLGYGGIENIEWENRRGEISLLINPEFRRKGHGTEAVKIILHEAFRNLSLDHVYAEVYECGNVEFWKQQVQLHNAETTRLPVTKFWGGTYYDSLLFTFYQSF